MAAVAVGAVASAATVDWSCTKVYTDSETKASGIAYFVTTATASVDSWASLKNADEFKTALTGSYSWTPGTAGTYSGSASNAQLGLSDSTAYTAYIIVFNTAEITDASSYFITGTQDFTTYSGDFSVDVTFGNQKTASTAAAWSTVSVPEPTSGLLMLLGVAGLALRRRRA